MNLINFILEERAGEWWVIREDEDERLATDVEVSLWTNLMHIISARKPAAARGDGLIALLMICGTIIASVYMIWGG